MKYYTVKNGKMVEDKLATLLNKYPQLVLLIVFSMFVIGLSSELLLTKIGL